MTSIDPVNLHNVNLFMASVLDETFKPTTKQCVCGSTFMCLLTSQNVKIYYECKREIPWRLDEGQKPVYS